MKRGADETDPPVKEWQGDRDAVNLMHTDGKRYSYNQLREKGFNDSTIVRNWNLDITPKLKSRTTMAEPVMGFEQRPVQNSMTREEAFRQARAAGEKEFTYEGKKYTTELASDKKQTMQQSVPAPVSIATPVTPEPYVSPYTAPYANMSREQLEEHIKKSWTKSEPYGDVPFSSSRRTAHFLTPEEQEKMRFVNPTPAQHDKRFGDLEFDTSTPEGFLFDEERYVLEKNGQNPRAVTHLEDIEAHPIKHIQATEASDVFKKMKWMDDEEIRKAAGQLDSIYSVSPTFNPMSVYDQTIRSLSSIDLFGPGLINNTNAKPDTITTSRPTRPTQSTTIEFQDGGYLPNYRDGGETDPPIQDVTYQDLKEYRKAVQATADSTQNYNAAVSDYELIMKNAAATDAIDRGPTFYDPDNNAFKSGEYDRAALLAERNGVPGTFMTSGNLNYTGTQNPIGNLSLQNISGNNEGEFGFYKKPTTNPVFVDTIMQKFPPMPANKIEPRRANDLAGYFRGAKLATVDTKLQPIQSNFKPKSVGYTSNTAAGYPMIQRGGGTGRVSKGAYWVPGRGYKYTND